MTTRQWLVQTQETLAPLLPSDLYRPILTEQLYAGNGKAADIYKLFDKDPDGLNVALTNYWALLHTAQAIGTGDSIDHPPTPWEGFSSVWIPVAPGVELHGRLGLVEENGKPTSADCIVILPGMLGDNKTLRTRDLANALHDSGFHVLAIELRGQGQTEARFPNITHNYGVTETVDLMRVSDWLVDHPNIRETGLIGFSWGANLALIAAWLDGAGLDHPSITEDTARHLEPISDRNHYKAGILAFSPVIDWEDLVHRLDQPAVWWINPSLAFLQNTVRTRMKRKGYVPINGSLRELIDHEFANSIFTAKFPTANVYQFMRLIPYQGRPAGDKLESTRIPTLIVHSVNDPVASAQAIADLVAATDNPNLACLILPGGGHVGFAPYARDWYYSLIVNFFDPHRGPAACANLPRQTASRSIASQ